jgi:chromate transporter
MTRQGDSPLSIFLAFLRFGLAAFGTDEAQIARLRRQLVDRRAWLTPETFAEIAVLTGLPGAAGLHIALAAGRERSGLAGALAAGLGYLAPAGLAAIMLGAFWTPLESLADGAWVHGAKAAGAAIVLSTILAMGRRLVRGPIRVGIAAGAGVGLVLTAGPAAQLAAIAVGAVFGVALLREETPDSALAPPAVGLRSVFIGLLVFAVLLAGLPVAAALLNSPELGLAGAALRAGGFAFSDSRMILPLLEAETHGRGWLSTDAASAGFALVSALPGPALAYAGFVGAAQDYAAGGWMGGVIALAMAVLPAVLFAQAAAPIRALLVSSREVRAALAGAGATAVGVLAACLWRTMLPAAISRPSDWALVAAAWIFISVARLPAWATMLGFAVATAIFRR